MANRRYHKTIDYLILAAELTNDNKLNLAAKALVKATSIPGARKALAELDAQQQMLQDGIDQEVDVMAREESKTARALARALSLSSDDRLPSKQPARVAAAEDEDEDEDEDDDSDEEDSSVEEADNVDLENVTLETDDTDGQLMRDTAVVPDMPDTTKASVVAQNLRKALYQRFKSKPAARSKR